MAKRLGKAQRLVIQMPFEDAVRKILKAGPMPKSKAKPRQKTKRTK
jgi:hypothetical protein